LTNCTVVKTFLAYLNNTDRPTSKAVKLNSRLFLIANIIYGINIPYINISTKFFIKNFIIKEIIRQTYKKYELPLNFTYKNITQKNI